MDLIRQLTPVVLSIHFRPNLKEIRGIGEIGIASPGLQPPNLRLG